MSARLLKKVLREQEEFQQQNHLKKEEEEEEEQVDDSGSLGTGGRSSINPFDLLNDGDEDRDSDQGIESEIVDGTLVEKKSVEEHHLTRNSQPGVPLGQKSKKKKKKKSKEGILSAGKTETSLDQALEALSLDVNSACRGDDSKNEKVKGIKSHDNSIKKTPQSVLQVDPKYLNVENELRRIFGSRVVRSFEKGNQSGSSRQVRGGRRGTHHVRKTALISPSEHWPRWDGSFSMEFLETKNGYHYFRYVHSSSYEQAQRAFQAAQAIHDLNGVASVLLHHPYHIDSLMTMADYFRFVGEHQMSADAIGKCLYALECAWHPMFNPFQGNCQLKFHHEANKPLFTTLFTHMRNMDRRGCHRSALEVCKLLLSLDKDDPVGALFCIDYFALRAEEYAWLEQFSEEYKSDNSLWLFPNFSYSLAISRLYLESSPGDTDTDTPKASSLDLMKQALLLHPTVLKKLVAKVPLKDQAWTNILKHSYFRSDQSRIPSLDHLVNIYVERSYLIWRLPDVQKLLRAATELVIDILEQNESDAKDWACVRKEAFPSDKNEYAHLMVQDFSDAIPTLPPENLQNFVVDPRMADPAMQIRDQVAEQLRGGHVQPPARDVANRNPLAVLLESLLPWVHYGDAEEVAGDLHEANHQPHGHGHGEDNQDQ